MVSNAGGQREEESVSCKLECTDSNDGEAFRLSEDGLAKGVATGVGCGTPLMGRTSVTMTAFKEFSWCRCLTVHVQKAAPTIKATQPTTTPTMIPGDTSADSACGFTSTLDFRPVASAAVSGGGRGAGDSDGSSEAEGESEGTASGDSDGEKEVASH